MSDYFLLQEADQSLNTSQLAEPSYRMLYLTRIQLQAHPPLKSILQFKKLDFIFVELTLCISKAR